MAAERALALAVRDFLQRRREEQTLLRLNEVYANGADPAEKALLKRIKTQVRSTVKERW